MLFFVVPTKDLKPCEETLFLFANPLMTAKNFKNKGENVLNILFWRYTKITQYIQFMIC